MARLSALLAALAVVVLGVHPAVAQNYPNQPIRVIVPFAPGGINDVLARLIATPLSKRLGQSVVVENRAGGGSQLGIASVAKAAPDGYTLLFGTGDGMMLIPALKKNVPYDVLKDFTPLGLVRNERGHVITVHPAVQANTVDELVKLSHQKPNGLTYGTTGIGSVPHLGTILMQVATKAKLIHVPYGGAGPAVTALLAHQVDFSFLTPTTAAPQIRAGKLRAVAQTGDERHYLLPDVPTTKEAGIKEELAIDAWSGLFGPANMDPKIAARLAAELDAVLSDPETVKAFHERGVTVNRMTPEQLGAFMARMLPKWTAVAEAHKLRE